MNKLESKYNELEKGIIEESDEQEIVGLPAERKNKFQLIWQAIKKILFKSGEEYKKEIQ